ncbi:signal peptidase II [Candidatus Chloroploca asiatica]|uniref:Lipoprotein signal peptidase n=1 Tax=Candidatus Chloroploca asiatica TaxID=1506545 RepID=A0A2H3KTR0_9CHLR|nr:signal peptidase II [Candidatus Chloroploca asiatica]PDV97252.1 signal peptidase II [Candidatus Chloroploca asiatica]
MRASVSPSTQTQRWLLPLLVGVSIFVLDQMSKAWAVNVLGPEPHQRSLYLFDDWLILIYTRNTGVAFGLFQNLSALFIVTSLLITGGLIYAYIAYLPNQRRLIQGATGLIVGGALGNVLDRIRLGYVVDFISVGWWPVFNLADSAITVGTLTLATYLIFVGDEPAPAPLPPPRDDTLLGELLSKDVEV